MRPLSATECISPAIERTKLLLFTPFRKGRTWKLSATAYLCRIGTMGFPFPLLYLFLIPAVRRGGGAVAATLFTVCVVAFSVLFLWIFHLCSRLQFAFFDIVVHRGEFVAPAWRKYPQSIAWTGWKLVSGLILSVIFTLPLVALGRHFLSLMETESFRAGKALPPEFMGAIFAFYGIFFLIFGPIFLGYSLLSDFVVPSLALEDTGVREALRRMFALIRGEPGPFAVYTLLKVVLGIVAYMAATIAWEFAFLVATAVAGGIVLAIGFLLHLAGVPTVVLAVLGGTIGVIWYFFALFYSLMLAIGPVLTFLDAYALYFLGGRYPMLGDLLDRSTPPPAFHPYPLPVPPAYTPLPPPVL